MTHWPGDPACCHTYPSVSVRVLLALQTGFWGDRNLILDEFSPENPRPPPPYL